MHWSLLSQQVSRKLISTILIHFLLFFSYKHKTHFVDQHHLCIYYRMLKFKEVLPFEVLIKEITNWELRKLLHGRWKMIKMLLDDWHNLKNKAWLIIDLPRCKILDHSKISSRNNHPLFRFQLIQTIIM